MSREARRIVITLIVGAVALGIALVLVFGPGTPKPPSPKAPTEPSDTTAATGEQPGGDGEGAAAEPGGRGGGAPDRDEDHAAGEGAGEGGTDEPTGEPPAALTIEGLRAVAPAATPSRDNPPATLGSLDWREAEFLVEFALNGAGIERITLSDIWETAAAKREAERVKERILAGEASLADLPEDERYVVQRAREFWATNEATGQVTKFNVPAFPARTLVLSSGDSSAEVTLYGNVWSQSPDDPGLWTTEIHDAGGTPLLRLTRRYTIYEGRYDLRIDQTIENLTDAAIDVQWRQYGPADLDPDRAAYMDRRRYRIGHLLTPERDPGRSLVHAETDFFWERSGVIDMAQTPSDQYLWPAEETGYDLTWFAAENRYFGVAIHPPGDESGPARYTLEDVVAVIQPFYDGSTDEGGNDNVVIQFESPAHAVDPGGSLSLDFAVYAGPLDRKILSTVEPYASLNMDELILYQISSFCAMCTFQWLAVLLLHFLSFGHMIFQDWAVAIILLVVVVRLALHPLTKKSQVSMQRFGKVMQKLKPELDKLQQKYKDDRKRYQQEQMRLMREYGVSPMSMLGCLPMLLQMPIWIALYAMLYFAWDLRHQAGFWGVFQLFGGWPFLADLSDGDHFFGSFAEPIQFFFWNVTGINLLPILMGALFFFQQKYMSPPTTNASPEQQQMQKMMKIMMPVLFPLMLYSAPSGLTLYILTSSCWGIIESRHIRRHIDELDLEKDLADRRAAKKEKKKKPKDAQGRAYRDALERAKQKRQPPPKRFKKRK